MNRKKVSLDDKYSIEKDRIFLTGTQALVRLTLLQRRLDKINGIKSAGYVSGYRGSPLGGIDKEFSLARSVLTENDIKFHPAVNEDLAATAIWGTQQLNLYPGAKYEGIFSMWYGKGPGVDRSGDALRHANLAGTSANGGVLVLAGDDPACKSSTVPSQSEYALIDVCIPVLNPTNVEEILRYGLYGWAMSRYSGCWVGMKCITDNIDTSCSLQEKLDNQIIIPEDILRPASGLHIRWPDPAIQQEERLHSFKIPAALAFAKANKLNKIMLDSSVPQLGIVSTGKAYLDTIQALQDLGIGEREAEKMGLRLYKVGMPWPLEKEGLKDFASGLKEIIVIEEKRSVIEPQIKEQLFHWGENVRPKIIGKLDEFSKDFFSVVGELDPSVIAERLATRIRKYYSSEKINSRLAFLEKKKQELTHIQTNVERLPYFCSGCPHNSSTKVPEGSNAMAGIGCHYMVLWMNRSTTTFTHMGAEGASWIGQAPFSNETHMFVNIGDGTYFHSGIMAIRASIAASINITYKILYNDAVAMTGGQSLDGPIDVPMITRQVHAEGAKKIVVISDEPHKYSSNAAFAEGVTVHQRDSLDSVQRQLREIKGVTILIFDQTCAAEKRRRRKRGIFPDPPMRVFINEDVCEGCGDCGSTSNCVSVVPVETELGRKRAINQSACNKDFSCISGFCPSFVTVSGAELKTVPFEKTGDISGKLIDPKSVDCSVPYSILITGIGGTGVVTIGAILAAAAHIEQKGVTVLDIAGLAQKNGAVFSHVRLAETQDKLHAVRISDGGANLLIGCDIVTSATHESLRKLNSRSSRVVVNSYETMTADFTSSPDLKFPKKTMVSALKKASGPSAPEFINATDIAATLLGNTIAANMLLVGYVYQKGLIPLQSASILEAIELNGVSVDLNLQAFDWGRKLANEPELLDGLVADRKPCSIDTFVNNRIQDLTSYQNAAYANRYKTLIDRVRQVEGLVVPKSQKLLEAVAKSAYKVMAYKDEYEVGRLFTNGKFEQTIKDQFQKGGQLKFYLAPPLFSKKDPHSGKPKKIEFGPWIMPVFKLLAKFKKIRGTFLDPFGYTAERKSERQLVSHFEETVIKLLENLSTKNYTLAIEIASIPQEIRGFGHVKEEGLLQARKKWEQLLSDFESVDHNIKKRAAE